MKRAVGDPTGVRYVPVTHVRPVSVEQARLCMHKLVEVLAGTWGPNGFQMIFAAGAGKPYQAGFALRGSAGTDASTAARDLRDAATVIAPWLGLGKPTAECPWQPLGPASHVLVRGNHRAGSRVRSSTALAWPLCARDAHRWVLAVDVGELLEVAPGSESSDASLTERAVRCSVTLYGDGPRRDLIANLMAADSYDEVALVADPVRPRQRSRSTVLPMELVGQLLAAPARVPDAFVARPTLSRDALMDYIAAAATPHLLVVGASGQGKTCFLENVVDDAAGRGEPVAVVDVHDGRLTDTAAASCLEHGHDPELIDFSVNPPPTLQLTQAPPGVEPSTWAAELYWIIRDLLWADLPAEYFGPVFERTLRAGLEVLVRDPAGAQPLHALPRLLDPDEDNWREELLRRIGDPTLAHTIANEVMPMLKCRDAGNTYIWLTAKLEPLIGDPYLRRVTSGSTDTTAVEAAIAGGRPFLLHAPARLLGDQGSRVVVATLLHRIWLAVRRRNRPLPLHVVVDEWQRYPVPSLATMLAEGRKFGLKLRLANQNLAQLPPTVRDTVLGNIGTLACFRTGPADAACLEGFFPTITQGQLQTLPRHHLAMSTGDTDLITPAPPPWAD